jgi:hypothetical protein
MRPWLAVFLVACGLSPQPFPSDDIAETPDARPDTTLPPEASTFDVSNNEDATKFNGGGPFTCGDCTCDGTLNYCVEVSGGKAPILDAGADDASADAGLGSCDPEASACTQIPIDCLPKPTCDCVMQQYKPPCTCDVDPSGNGLVITCDYP